MFEEDNFYTISKTATIVGVQTHVLRFWEKKFLFIKPRKSSTGRRYYSSSDIKYLLMIKKLLYEEGFTIKGANNLINNKYKDKNISFYYRANKSISAIKSLLNEGTSILKKNLD
jgi:DNA-binding transcriptional MerR regulator